MTETAAKTTDFFDLAQATVQLPLGLLRDGDIVREVVIEELSGKVRRKLSKQARMQKKQRVEMKQELSDIIKDLRVALGDYSK